MPAKVNAAGGVVVRRDSDRAEICLIHRPRYDDWSVPKGKLDDGESFADAALREVWEETGLRCRLGDELAAVRYHDHKDRPKVVRYWRMEVTDDEGFAANDEVDEVRWLAPVEAANLATYEHDRRLLAAL